MLSGRDSSPASSADGNDIVCVVESLLGTGGDEGECIKEVSGSFDGGGSGIGIGNANPKGGTQGKLSGGECPDPSADIVGIGTT